MVKRHEVKFETKTRLQVIIGIISSFVCVVIGIAYCLSGSFMWPLWIIIILLHIGKIWNELNSFRVSK